MSEDEARSFNERTLEACCATEVGGRTGTDRLDYDRWSHYAQPDWWRSGWYTSPPVDRTVIGARPVPGTASYDVPTPSSETRARERVIARDRADIDVDRTRRDRLDEGTVEERAQPGDVLGIEHAGETTSLGETAHDERERLRDEEEAAAKLRREEIERRKDRR